MLKDNITKPFSTNAGLKQGNILSTLFFNLYINVLPAYSTLTDSDVIQLERPKLCNSEIVRYFLLLFAENLAILALSKKVFKIRLIFQENIARIGD